LEFFYTIPDEKQKTLLVGYRKSMLASRQGQATYLADAMISRGINLCWYCGKGVTGTFAGLWFYEDITGNNDGQRIFRCVLFECNGCKKQTELGRVTGIMAIFKLISPDHDGHGYTLQTAKDNIRYYRKHMDEFRKKGNILAEQ
jgi:hypothetical protein